VTVQTPTSPASTTPATRYPTGRSRILWLLVGVALLALTCVTSLAVGTQNVGLATVWHAVTAVSLRSDLFADRS
jgi:iron-siderophore transport system permease protein